MKRWASLSFNFILIFLLIGCSSNHEEKVLDYYNMHITEMKDNIESHYKDGKALSSPSKDVSVKVWNGEHTIVEYLVTGAGIAPASQYFGFFYSKDDVPVPFQNSGEEMVNISTTEWEWHGEGDNHGYVRKIEPNWYYYEASF